MEPLDSRAPRHQSARLQPSDVALPAVVGLGAGAVAKLADEASGWAGDLTSYLGLWVVVLVVVGRTGPTVGRAAVRGASLLAAVTLSYYAAAVTRQGSSPEAFLAFWLVVSITAAPGVAALAHRSRDDDWAGAVGVALPAGLLLAEAWMLQALSTTTRPTQVAFDGTAAVVLLATLPASGRARVRSSLLLVVAVAAGIAAIVGIRAAFAILGP